MSIVPTQPGPAESGPVHPSWCAQRHPEWPVHEVHVGVDLELSADLAYRVLVQNVHGDHVTDVLLVRLERGTPAVTRFSIVEASILRDLLSEALALVAG